MRRIPTADHKRLLRITYLDGRGVLRDILGLASTMGFASTIQSRQRRTSGDRALISMDIRFIGRQAIRDLMPPLMELQGVENITLKDAGDEENEENDRS